MAEKCFFCEFQKEENIKRIIDNRYFYSMYDYNPVSRGHCLIVPKRHIESFFELEKHELESMYELIKETRELIKKKYNPDGFNIGVNNGKAAGQTVFHLHIHLIPRYNGDVENPVGGVRNVIPEKGDYTKTKHPN